MNKKHPPAWVAWSLIGLILGAALYGSAFVLGANVWHPAPTRNVPSMCKTLDQLENCVEEALTPLTGGQRPSVECSKTNTRNWYCDVRVTGICGDLTLYRAPAGFPILKNLTQRDPC